MNDLHGLGVHFYLIFQIGKGLLDQQLMTHTLKLIKQECSYYSRLMKHLL